MTALGVFLLVSGAAMFLSSGRLKSSHVSVRRMNAVIGVMAFIAGLTVLFR
jgi:uncharacterized membrane protein HdeD (DUF308 family)